MERAGPVRRDSLRQHAKTTRRDAYLGRVASTTKAVGLATIAAVGAFAFYVSRALPGHTTKAPTAATQQPATQQPAGTAAPSATGQAQQPAGSTTTLTPPTSPPVRTTRPAPVITNVS